MNIDEVKRFFDFIANKNQAGSITPSQFNLVAERSQIDIFMSRFGNPQEYQPGRPIPRIAYQNTQKISDDLRPFIIRKLLQVSVNGELSIPDDYIHLSSIRKDFSFKDKKGNIKSKQISVKVVRDNEVADYSSSSILAPSSSSPIAFFVNDNIMQFEPKLMGGVIFTYLRMPKKPVFGFTLVNNRPVFDLSISVDFEFPDIVHNEIIFRMGSYFGINLREGELVQWNELKKNQGN